MVVVYVVEGRRWICSGGGGWWWEEVVRCRCFCGGNKGGMCRVMEVFWGFRVELRRLQVWQRLMGGSVWNEVGDAVLRGGD